MAEQSVGQTDIDPIREEYKHRYDEPLPDLESRLQDYPHFIDQADIEHIIRTTAEFPLVDKKPFDEYEPGEPVPQGYSVLLPPEELRAYFTGTGAELEGANVARSDYFYGIQITDPRVQIPEDVKTRLVDEAKLKAVEGKAQVIANSKAWWLNKNWKVDTDIQEGRLTEAYELSLGDNKIQLVNLDKPLDEETLNGISVVIEKIARATNGRIFDCLNTLVLQHNDRFEPGVFGEALGITGAFRLNTAIIELNHIIEENGHTKGYGQGYKYWQTTLAHEIGHMMDISDLRDNEAWEKLKEIEDDEAKSTQFRSAFGPLVGWRHKKHQGEVDGQKKQHTIRGISSPPTETLILDDGKLTKVNTLQHFGKTAIDTATPVSSYGSTREEEDFAEAFAAYVLDGPEAVDPIRRAALELTFSALINAQPVEISPDEQLAINKQDLANLKTDIDTPKVIPLSVFIRTGTWTKAPDFMLLINPPTDEELAIQGYYKD